MKININNAIATFFSNPSYEQIYFEAVANALDAGADEISIQIKIDSFDKPDTLKLIIKDNEKGFIDRNFKKFSKLLEVDNNDHKGLGRLVYLVYFDKVEVESYYEGRKKRIFTFDSSFNGKSKVGNEERISGSSLYFDGYLKDRIYTYDYLIPNKIKENLIQHFFSLFFRKKENGDKLNFCIDLDVISPKPSQEFFSSKIIFSLDDLPKLEKTNFSDLSLGLFENFDIHYSVQKNIEYERSIYTAVCIDDRTIELDLVPIEAIPNGCQLKFIFISEYFKGKTNASRQKIELPDELTERNLKESLRKEISNIINLKLPRIILDNQRTAEELHNFFPHLAGYFPPQSVGLIIKSVALEEAQKKFFGDQRKVLECENLDDKQYEKALELASRTLAEYVMYRKRIISKLENMTPNNDEKELHRLIVPMRKTLKTEEFNDDIYNNNVWVLDDRFMSYNTLLSDETMTDVIKAIALDEAEDSGSGRPDITIVFSGNPDREKKVSVVVIELKKYGLPLAKNEEVVSQLRQRARKLLKHFPNKIEKIWFYGITEINSEFRISLKESGFKELFSHGQIFFKPQDIIVEDENSPFIVDLFIMTYESLLEDAKSRNETFLRILKSAIQKCMPSTGDISQ
jgi:hypothetical protein